MKKYGILMTSNLAQKAHDGLKTVMRRLMKPQPIGPCEPTCGNGWYDVGAALKASSSGVPPLESRYRPGMVVAVKETHWRWGQYERNEKGNWAFVPGKHLYVGSQDVIFRPVVIEIGKSELGYHKRPNLFLPFDLARTHIEILDVRPELVQDIDNTDILAEGITPLEGEPSDDDPWDDFEVYYAQAFRDLWDSINAKKASWDSNPWTWRYCFKRVEKP